MDAYGIGAYRMGAGAFGAYTGAFDVGMGLLNTTDGVHSLGQEADPGNTQNA